MKYIIGIDIGSQSIRVHLYDERMRLVCGKAVEQYIDTEHPSWASQKAGFWWETIKTGLRYVVETSGISSDRISAIGCCGHMHGPVPLSKEGTLLSNDIQLYCDKRATNIADRLQGEEKQYRGLVANSPAPSWWGIKIKWIKDNQRELYDRTYKFLTTKDYINYMLTGVFATDLTEASGAYLMDWQTGQWSDKAIAKVGIDKAKLPDIYETKQVIGTVSSKAAERTGLSKKTRVICGCGDMLASLYASGHSTQGVGIDLTATASLVSTYSEQPLFDKQLMNLHSAIDGWVPYGELDAAGAGFRWLRDTVAKYEKEQAKQRNMNDYDYLSRLASEVPAGSKGLLYLPYLQGERVAGSVHSRGCFIGLYLESDVAQMTRAFLEGVAFEHKRIIDRFIRDGVAIEKVYHVSGGAKGKLWNQIKADVYQIPVYTLKEEEGTAVGIALLAGVGCGLIANDEQALELVFALNEEFLPNKDHASLYGDMYEVFCELHDMMQSPFERLAGIGMNRL